MSGIQWKVPGIQTSKEIWLIIRKKTNQLEWPRYDKDDIIPVKNMKTIIITIFYMFKKVEENIIILSRGFDGIKKTQIRLMKMKNTMFKNKNTLHGINSRLDRDEEILVIYQQQKVSYIIKS